MAKRYVRQTGKDKDGDITRLCNSGQTPPGGGLTPAGPRQGIGLRFSLPLPSSPEGRRHGGAMRASGGLWLGRGALFARLEGFFHCDCTGAVGSPLIH